MEKQTKKRIEVRIIAFSETTIRTIQKDVSSVQKRMGLYKKNPKN